MSQDLKTALHIHTWQSADSSLTKKEFISLYQKAGYSCLAITDHNEIAGAQELVETGEFKVVVGEEIETRDGDLIGLFLSEKISAGLSIEETIQEIRRQKGLTYLPHPFDRLRQHIIKPQKILEIIKSIDIIEVFNARNVFASDDQKAECLLKSLTETGLEPVSTLPIPVCGLDAHTRYEIGKTYIMMKDFNSPTEFLKAVKNGQMIQKYSPKFVQLITKWRKWTKK